MQEGKAIIGAARQVAAIWIATVILAIPPLGGASAAQRGAAKAAPAAGEGAATSPKVHELVTLLADPTVQEWLKQEAEKKSAAEAAPDSLENSVSQLMDARLGAIREHIVALAATVPDLPNQFERAVGLLQAEIPRRGTVAVLVLVFASLGFGVEWLYRKTTQKTRQRVDGLPMETVNDRLRLVAVRFAFAFGGVVAFAIGSAGPFLALDWPPLLRQLVFGYLVALLATRIAVVVGRFLLPPKPSASASFRRIRGPPGSGADGSPCSPAGLPLAGSPSAC
jgi:hypothetical protein